MRNRIETVTLCPTCKSESRPSRTIYTNQTCAFGAHNNNHNYWNITIIVNVKRRSSISTGPTRWKKNEIICFGNPCGRRDIVFARVKSCDGFISVASAALRLSQLTDLRWTIEGNRSFFFWPLNKNMQIQQVPPSLIIIIIVQRTMIDTIERGTDKDPFVFCWLCFFIFFFY